MCKDSNDTVAREPYLSTLPCTAIRSRRTWRRAQTTAALRWRVPLRAQTRVERFGCRATVSFESLHIRISSKFCENSGKLSQIFRNSESLRTSQHFLGCSAKFRKKIIEICAKFDANCRKIRIFAKITAKMRKKFYEFLRIF